jgi:hypothetical protein
MNLKTLTAIAALAISAAAPAAAQASYNSCPYASHGETSSTIIPTFGPVETNMNCLAATKVVRVLDRYRNGGIPRHFTQIAAGRVWRVSFTEAVFYTDGVGSGYERFSARSGSSWIRWNGAA